MALLLTDAIKDRISRLLWQQDHSALDTTKAAMITDEGTGSLSRIQQYAQWFEQAGATTAPDVWDSWLVWQTVFDLGQHAKPDLVTNYQRSLDRAIDDALNAFSKTDPDSATAAGQTFTVKSIRFFTLLNSARNRDRNNERILLPPDVIDAELQWVVNHVWNIVPWRHRRRQVTFSIAANGTVTDDLAGSETFHSIATLYLYYEDDARQRLSWLDADDTAVAKAYDAQNDDETGRPRWFRITTDSSGTKNWIFSPAPDKAYTVRGEVAITGPDVLDSATDGGVLSTFPATFRPCIRNMVLGRILKNHGVGRELYDEAAYELDRYLPVYEDIGKPDTQRSAEDVFHDDDYMVCDSL